MVQLITAMKNEGWDAVYDQWGRTAYKPISQRFKNIMRPSDEASIYAAPQWRTSRKYRDVQFCKQSVRKAGKRVANGTYFIKTWE